MLTGIATKLMGLRTWMMLSAVPIWMTEVVPPAIRGTLVDIHGACLLFGYAFASWVGYGFYWLDSPDAWRGPFGIATEPRLNVTRANGSKQCSGSRRFFCFPASGSCPRA